jgi:hypothetical protein
MTTGGWAMNMNWSGQSGQPTWLWGGENGTDMYVYNPANFAVAYATSAGSAPASDVYPWAKASSPPYSCKTASVWHTQMFTDANGNSGC